MKNILVILLASMMTALLAGGAFYILKFNQSALGRYQLMADSANHVWKLDTKTGQIWYCSIAPGVIYRDLSFIDCAENPDASSLASNH